MNDPHPGPVDQVYGFLLLRHVRAAGDGDEALRTRIFSAIQVLEELWPTETARWRALAADVDA